MIRFAVNLFILLMSATVLESSTVVNVAEKSRITEVKDSEDIAFVKCEISNGDIFVGQGIFVTMWLYSKSSNIAYVQEKESPYLKKGEFAYISKVEEMSKPRKEVIKGTEYWVMPIAKYLVMMNVSGKYELKGGIYSIGINMPVVYNDPFFGRVRRYETKSYSLNMQEEKFRVKDLPKVPTDFPFSGAVGEFELETLTQSEIIINYESTAVIRLKGKGFIGNDILPEYREAFGQGNKLKSVSHKERAYFDGEDIISVKELECEFIPESRTDCEIGVVRFGYFNPYKSKYEIAESKPVRLKVESSTIKREAIDI